MITFIAVYRRILWASLALFVCSIPLAAQTLPSAEPLSPQETSALNSLLIEVRTLRIVLQNANTGAKRIQLAAERIRLQQERVDKVNRELEETRNQLAENKANQMRLDEMLKELERQIRQEGFPARRSELEKQYRVAKIEAEPLTVREGRLKDRESQLLAQLQYEQAKLNELNGRLDELEREFDAQAALERPMPERKKR
jgi:chromosome segregation ATPase